MGPGTPGIVAEFTLRISKAQLLVRALPVTSQKDGAEQPPNPAVKFDGGPLKVKPFDRLGPGAKLSNSITETV
jgi:hypothetical protein